MAPVPTWRLEVLGVPTLTGPDGRPQHPEKNTLALLAVLALDGAAARSRLAGLLWPDTVESAARNNLVHLLRRTARTYGPDLVLSDDLVRLGPGVHVDASGLLDPTRAPQAEASLPAELLEGVSFDGQPELSDWLLAWRERLTNVRTGVLTELAETQEGRGEFGDAVATTRRLLDLDPVSELAYRRLIRLYYLMGDRGAALAAFERCKAVLNREFGTDPLPETVNVAREAAREVKRDPAAPDTRTRRPRIPLSVLRPPTLIGREDAWSALERAWEAGQFIIVAGEAGVGKSRLVREFALSKGEVLHLEGRPGDPLVPYATMARNLRRIFARTPDLPLEPWMRRSLAPLVPELAGSDPTPETAEPDARVHAAIQYVFQRGLTGLGALVYDDLHLADRASIEAGFVLISSAFPLGRPGGVPRLLCTVRPAELDPFTLETFRRGGEMAHNIRVDLEPLGERDVAALVRDLDVPEVVHLASALSRFTGGNPLFVLETVKHLIETPSEDGSLPVAARASQLIEGRLARLSSSALGAARAAAVLQSDLSVELVADVLGAPLLDMVGAWEELEDAQVMTGERFSHDLVQETVLSGIPPAVWRLLNRSAARTLTREGASAARIARHWHEGGDLAAAAPLFERAGHDALSGLRPVEAVEFFERAAELYEALGQPDEAFGALVRAAESPWRSERVERLDSLVDRARQAARTPEQHARVSVVRSARLLGRGQAEAAQQVAAEALTRLGEGPVELRAALLRELLTARSGRGDVPGTDAVIEEVLAAHAALGDLRSDALGAGAVGGALLRVRRDPEAEPYLRHAARSFDAAGERYLGAWNRHSLAVSLLGQGRLDEVVELRLDLQTRLEGANAPSLHRVNLSELGMTYTRLHAYDEALKYLERAAEYGKQLGEPHGALDRAFADLFWTLGAFEDCEAALDRADAHPDARDAAAFLTALLRGQIQLRRGDHAQARRTLSALDSQLDRSPLKVPYSRGRLALARAELAAPGEALTLASDALTLARTNGLPDLETAALTAQAEAWLALGDEAEAARASAEAASRLPAHGPRDDHARPLLIRHRVLAALGDPAADAALNAALTWLDAASVRVPAPYREAFLTAHRTHRDLQELRSARTADRAT